MKVILALMEERGLARLDLLRECAPNCGVRKGYLRQF